MEPPLKPDPSDCCNSGCNPCILDVYEEQLKRYERLKQQTRGPPQKNCLSPTVYTNFTVTAIEKHTKNTYFYTFAHANEGNNGRVVYEPGQHFLMRGSDGKPFTRAYTPIPHRNAHEGTFTILVRLYEGGRMSQILHNIKMGEQTSWRGPYGDYQITYDYRHLLMIAQGTGIAPIYSVIMEMLTNDQCEVFLKLLFCCSSDDILLRDELNKLKLHWNFTCEIFLSGATNVDVKYGEVIHTRRLNCDDVKGFFGGKNAGECRTLICGSEGFGGDFLKCVCECIEGKHVHVF